MAKVLIDRAHRTTVLVCRSCGWRELVTGGMPAARRAARRHELRTHPGEVDQARS